MIGRHSFFGMHEEMHSNYYARYRALPKKWSDQLFNNIIMLVMLKYVKMTATNVSLVSLVPRPSALLTFELARKGLVNFIT